MQTVYNYRGAIDKLPACIDNRNSVLLFCGNSSWKKYSSVFEMYLVGKKYDIFNDFSKNPKLEEIQNAITLNDDCYDVIIAFGGGSVIDFAKAFRYLKKLCVPLIAIPTTAGTGSESTQFAVVYENGEKKSLDAPSILPDVAIADSQFSENAPVYIKACVAMDAFCQAIESFWAVGATEQSRAYAKEAILIIQDNIVNAVKTIDKTANEKMMLASNLAGKAINISRTTAAHALSYYITSKYGIPHGHAVSLSMVDLFEANFNVTSNNVQDGLSSDIVQKSMNELLVLLKLNSIDEFRPYWHNLMEQLGLEWRLSELKIFDKVEIIKSVNLQRLSNNPKKLDDDLLLFWKE